jgi:spore coat polysaccharide biosynthesis protein SpsF (cytidylyltransferase family)
MTIDYPEDLQLLQRIFNNFKDDTFSWKEAVSLIEKAPALLDLSKTIRSKFI